MYLFLLSVSSFVIITIFCHEIDGLGFSLKEGKYYFTVKVKMLSYKTQPIEQCFKDI